MTAITFMGEWQHGHSRGAPGRAAFIDLRDESGPGTIAFLIRHICFFIVGLYRFRSLQALGLPSGRGKARYMGHIRPFALRTGGIQSVPPNILRSARWDVLCELQEKTHHGKGFGFLLEELVVGGIGDHRSFAVFLDAYLLQGQRRSGDVLGEGFAGFRGAGR